MAIDIERERRKQAAVKRRSGFSWKPQTGENIVRVFMFSHKVTKEDVAAGLFPKDLLGEKAHDWDRDLQVEYRGKDNKEEPKLNYRYALNIVDLNQEGKRKNLFFVMPAPLWLKHFLF